MHYLSYFLLLVMLLDKHLAHEIKVRTNESDFLIGVQKSCEYFSSRWNSRKRLVNCVNWGNENSNVIAWKILDVDKKNSREAKS